MERHYRKETGQAIPDTRMVKVKKMSHIIEVTSILKPSNGFQNIKKLNKAEYINLGTGEVLEYNLSVNRAENISGLKDTFKKIRDLINANFVGGRNEIHLTLTYSENMTDTKRLHKDFANFWKRYKRKYGDVDYLSVIEPQGRGAWHCHVLIRHNDKDNVYIPSSTLSDLWGQGFIKVKSLKGVDNIGAYLSAYLGDIELTDETTIDTFGHEIKEIQIDGKSKKYIKGGRLHLYPSGMNLYRHSKGISFPEIEEMWYRDIKRIVGPRTPNYSKTVTIYTDDKTILNQITYEQYNMKRHS